MKSYPSYKDSGVDWIGEIPEGWDKSKLKYLSNLFTGNSLNDEQKRMYESDNPNDIPYVSSKDIDVNYHTVNYNNGLRIPSENNPLKVGRKGSFLLCVEGGSSGRKMVFLEQDVCFVNKLCCFESDQITKFQFYFVQSSNFQFKFKLSLTGLIGGVSISTLRNFQLPFPPKETQSQIVSFLDNKTQKIDELIEKTEKKIELLKEKRTSLINHCVTKGLPAVERAKAGLNPNVEMKDSGVPARHSHGTGGEWIGEIPRDWISSKLKYHGKFFSGYSFDSGDFDDEGEVRVIKISNIQNNGISWDDLSFLPKEYYNKYEGFRVVKGDLVFVLTRPIISSGIKVCFYDEDYLTLLNQRNSVFRSDEQTLEKRFLFYLVRSFYFVEEFNQQLKETNQPNISTEQISNIKVNLPPSSEQTQIVEYLDEQTQKIDSTIEKETQRIELLKEYRQSLISEVVTGKVDVRGWKG